MESGILLDPFSGSSIVFTRGEDTSREVQIDHVVALNDAWQKGAQQWTPERRVAFANDPLNLLAVDGDLNARKGDGDAATWLPPARSFRCRYVARQIGVKAKYDVWVTAAERDAMRRVLSPCPDEPAPTSDHPTESTVGVATAERPPDAAGDEQATGAACEPAYLGTCVPPVTQSGDLDCPDVPGRRFRVTGDDPHGFDRDGDGIGCEG